MNSFNGKVILITGSSRGIGAEVAKVVAQSGAKVIINYTGGKEAAEKVARTAEKAKLDAMTSAEREAYIKANKPAKENIFASLVTAGILTQTQVDKIQASMPKRADMGKMKGQRPVGAPTI